MAYAGLVAIIQFLKRRLVDAERHQHQMARVDPLTGLANRRGFDEALDRALARRRGSRCCSPTSTSSSRSTTASATRRVTACCASSAAHASAEVRAGDCLARIGGDEFALVAPAPVRPDRLSDALRAAGRRVDAGDGPVSLTVAAAVYPRTATTGPR